MSKKNKHRDKQGVMQTKQELLADFVRRIMAEKGLTYRQVAENTGGEISYSTVYNVVNQRQKDIGAATLQALAKGLRVPESEMFAAARGEIQPPNYKEELRVLLELLNDAPDEVLQEMRPLLLVIQNEAERRINIHKTLMGAIKEQDKIIERASRLIRVPQVREEFLKDHFGDRSPKPKKKLGKS